MILLLILIGSLGQFHPLYLSTVKIEVHQDDSWSGTIKIFYDDLEDALQNESGTRPTLSIERLKQHIPEIKDYIKRHLIFKSHSSNRKLAYEIVSGERVEDVVFISLQGQDKWASNVLLTCDFLFDLFETQKNVFEIKFVQKSVYAYLKKGQDSEAIVKPE